MIVINYTEGNEYFTLNGKKYPQVYQAVEMGANSIAIYSIHDIRNRLLSTTSYTEVSVNGVYYNSQDELITALIPILYHRGATGSGGTGSVKDWQPIIDTKEDKFNKNTAFNKDFGKSEGTVAEGNDIRFAKGETAYGWGDHNQRGYLTELQANGFFVRLDGGEMTGDLIAPKFIVKEGLSTQFLKADGSLDDTEYITQEAIPAIIDALNSTDAEATLSANQGRVLKGYIDDINSLLQSDDSTLDELQEVVNFIKTNKEELENLGISNISGLQTALDNLDSRIDDHLADTDNPHQVSKGQVGLGNVDNTSDADKPISNATEDALDTKEDKFSKNTGFNKPFGTSAGTVAQGNDSRIKNGQTAFNWGDHAEVGYLTEFIEQDPKGISTIDVVGTDSKTITITRNDGTEASATFSDKDTTYANMLLSELNSGTATVGRLLSAKTLNDWINSKGYITGVSWSEVTGKPSVFPPEAHNHDDRYYTEGEVDTKLSEKSDEGHSHSYTELTDTPFIPEKTSDITNDSGFITGLSWSEVTGKPTTFTPETHGHDYSEINNTPTIPDSTSDLTNDSGFITDNDVKAKVRVININTADLDTVDKAGVISYLSAQGYSKARLETLIINVEGDVVTDPTEPTEPKTITVTITEPTEGEDIEGGFDTLFGLNNTTGINMTNVSEGQEIEDMTINIELI